MKFLTSGFTSKNNNLVFQKDRILQCSSKLLIFYLSFSIFSILFECSSFPEFSTHQLTCRNGSLLIRFRYIKFQRGNCKLRAQIGHTNEACSNFLLYFFIKFINLLFVASSKCSPGNTIQNSINIISHISNCS